MLGRLSSLFIVLEFVATGSYDMYMKPSKRVGIKDLKNNLSAYLREVRNGAHIIVLDRGSIVAELHEPYSRNDKNPELDPILYEWAQARLVILPVAPKMPLTASPVRLPNGTSAKLLISDREENR
jgi:antitoxin (DNA-binding transcriptional repressor) of toxin-antitoxin stability system